VILRAAQEEAVSTGRYEGTIAIPSNEQLLSGAAPAMEPCTAMVSAELDNNMTLSCAFFNAADMAFSQASIRPHATRLLVIAEGFCFEAWTICRQDAAHDNEQYRRL
jgi:hypothetical protein